MPKFDGEESGSGDQDGTGLDRYSANFDATPFDGTDGDDEGAGGDDEGAVPQGIERPKGLLPRPVIVLTAAVLIIVLAFSPMNQTIVPRPSLYKTLPFDRIDYAVLAQTLSRDGSEIDEVILIAPNHVNAEDLGRLAQELKWESPEGPRLSIALFSDAKAAALSARHFEGKATSEEEAIFLAGFLGTVTRTRSDGPVTLQAGLGDGVTLQQQY